MEIGLGQKYIVTSPSGGIAVLNTSTPFDLWAVTAAPNVPVAVERVVLTCNFDAAGTLAVQVVKRSAAGSGGSALIVGPDPTSAPAASLSANYNVATPGAQIQAYEPEFWQLFSSWELNLRPGARLLRPGETLALLMLAGNTNASLLAHLHAELVEVK